MEISRQDKWLNFIVNGDKMTTVGFNVSPRVADALEHGDEITWQEYLRLIHEAIIEYNKHLPDVLQDW